MNKKERKNPLAICRPFSSSSSSSFFYYNLLQQREKDPYNNNNNRDTAMIFSRIFSILLRILQMAAAIVVMGITSDYVHDVHKAHGNPADRLVYTLVIAVFSIVLAFFLLIPFTATLTLFPLDFLFFILWIVSFGLLVSKSKKKLPFPKAYFSIFFFFLFLSIFSHFFFFFQFPIFLKSQIKSTVFDKQISFT